MLLENLSDCYVELNDLVCDSDEYLFSDIDHLILINIQLLFLVAFFDSGRLFVRVSWLRVFDVILNLGIRAVLVFTVTVALDLFDHLGALVGFNFFVVATLRSFLLLLQRIVEHSDEYLILHAIYSVASRVNVIQHPVHQVVVNFLVN